MRKRNSNNAINWKVVIYSLIALICLGLSYYVHWLFIIPVGILIWLNQRALFKKESSGRKKTN